MAAYTDLKAELQAEINKTQRQLDWHNGTGGSQTWNIQWASDDTSTRYDWTGTGGASGYWAAWRTDNPTVSSGYLYEAWNDYTTNGSQFEGGETLAEHTTRMQGIIDGLQAQIDHIDDQIAAGITDSESSAPVGDPPPPAPE